MLIKAMDLKNTIIMSFKKAQEWRQVRLDECEKFLSRVRPPDRARRSTHREVRLTKTD
jgi:hypothetical protein